MGHIYIYIYVCTYICRITKHGRANKNRKIPWTFFSQLFSGFIFFKSEFSPSLRISFKAKRQQKMVVYQRPTKNKKKKKHSFVHNKKIQYACIYIYICFFFLFFLFSYF